MNEQILKALKRAVGQDNRTVREIARHSGVNEHTLGGAITNERLASRVLRHCKPWLQENGYLPADRCAEDPEPYGLPPTLDEPTLRMLAENMLATARILSDRDIPTTMRTEQLTAFVREARRRLALSRGGDQE